MAKRSMGLQVEARYHGLDEQTVIRIELNYSSEGKGKTRGKYEAGLHFI